MAKVHTYFIYKRSQLLLLIKISLLLLLTLSTSIFILNYELIKPKKVRGDLDTSTSHNQIIFNVNNRRYVCKICHAGYPITQPSEVTRIFENYRCVSCHMSIDTTTKLTEAHSDSPHITTGCTTCHDTAHFGHETYDTTTKGFYGCRADHQVVIQDLNPPPNVDVTFLVTYYVKEYNSTKTFGIDRKRWFAPENRTLRENIYPYAFIDPSTLKFSDIPTEKRYWICLKCHFTKVGIPTNQKSIYWVTHPDKCYDCHKDTSGYGASLFLLDPHAIKSGIYTPLNNCGTCHNGVNASVASSIHANVGCSCHSIIHISRYNGTASWISLFYPGPGLYKTPTTINLTAWLNLFHYDSSNYTIYNVSIYPIDAVTDVRYVGPYYVMRDGDASLITGKNLRFLTCFNCHFVNEPGTVSPFRLNLNGSIPISPESLLTIRDPHSIGPSGGTRVGEEFGGGSQYMLIAGLILGMAIILITLVYGFRRRVG